MKPINRNYLLTQKRTFNMNTKTANGINGYRPELVNPTMITYQYYTKEQYRRFWQVLDGKEVWLSVNHHPMIEVSSNGRIRYTDTKQILPQQTRKGYKIVSIRLNKHRVKKLNVQRTVLKAFYPIADADEKVVDHLDFDRANNSLKNLRWATHKQNVQHSLKAGRYKAAILKRMNHKKAA